MELEPFEHQPAQPTRKLTGHLAIPNRNAHAPISVDSVKMWGRVVGVKDGNRDSTKPTDYRHTLRSPMEEGRRRWKLTPAKRSPR